MLGRSITGGGACERQHSILRLVFNYLGDELGRDGVRIGGKSVNERGIAQNVNRSRYAAARLGDEPAGVIGK